MQLVVVRAHFVYDNLNLVDGVDEDDSCHVFFTAAVPAYIAMTHLYPISSSHHASWNKHQINADPQRNTATAAIRLPYRNCRNHIIPNRNCRLTLSSRSLIRSCS